MAHRSATYEHAIVQAEEQQKWGAAHPECTYPVNARADEYIILAIGRTPGSELTDEDGDPLDSEEDFRAAVQDGMDRWLVREDAK